MLGVYLRGWAIISPINFSTVSISILISAVERLWRLQSDNGRGVRDVSGRAVPEKSSSSLRKTQAGISRVAERWSGG